MRLLTLDASVVCKWFLEGAHDEPHLQEARAILDDLAAGRVALVQPVHWRVEVLSVVARRRPAYADHTAQTLARLNITVADGLIVEQFALQIVRETGAHLFDALYHAAALATSSCTLVTADARYLARARTLGSVMALDDYAAGVGEPQIDYRVIVQRALAVTLR